MSPANFITPICLIELASVTFFFNNVNININVGEIHCCQKLKCCQFTNVLAMTIHCYCFRSINIVFRITLEGLQEAVNLIRQLDQ